MYLAFVPRPISVSLLKFCDFELFEVVVIVNTLLQCETNMLSHFILKLFFIPFEVTLRKTAVAKYILEKFYVQAEFREFSKFIFLGLNWPFLREIDKNWGELSDFYAFTLYMSFVNFQRMTALVVIYVENFKNHIQSEFVKI